MSIYAIVTVFSLIGSYIPGILTRRGWNITRARKTGLFCYALLMLPILTVGIAGDRTAVILIGLAGAAHQAWSSNLFTTVSDMFPRHTIGAIIGMGSMAGAIGSMLFQYFCGHILDIYGADHASIAYFILFTYAAFAYLVSFGIQHLFAPRFEPLKIHPH